MEDDFEFERKRDILDNAAKEKQALYAEVCKRYLRETGVFGGDTVANQAIMDLMTRVYRETLRTAGRVYKEGPEVALSKGMFRWGDVLLTLSRYMADDVDRGHIDLYDMPDFYEEACTQIKLGRLCTKQEVEEFLDEHDEDQQLEKEEEEAEERSHLETGDSVTIYLDKKLCDSMTSILIKPEAPLKVTAITGTVERITHRADLTEGHINLSNCRIMTEHK